MVAIVARSATFLGLIVFISVSRTAEAICAAYNGTCSSCPPVPGVPGDGQCVACVTGYYSYKNGCYTCQGNTPAVKLPSQCTSCSIDKCTACRTGFTLSADGLACNPDSNPCPTYSDGVCASCPHDANGNAYGPCTECSVGYYLYKGESCNPCQGGTPAAVFLPAECTACTISKCTACKPGYTLSPDGLSCTSGCTTPKTIDVYGQCGGLSTTEYPPLDAPFPCTGCAQGSVCTKSSQYYYQCLPTRAGPVSSPSPPANPCPSYPNGVCAVCNPITPEVPFGICTLCSPGYYLYKGESCVPCGGTNPSGATLPAECIDCASDLRKCAACKPGFTLGDNGLSCTPNGQSPSPSLSPSSSPSGCTAPKALNLYDQCGGLSTNTYQPVDGPFPCTACPSGTSCIKSSQYYYQCVASAGPVSSPSPPANNPCPSYPNGVCAVCNPITPEVPFGRCTLCSPGYYLYKGESCEPCAGGNPSGSILPAECIDCANDLRKCAACKPGFTLGNNGLSCTPNGQSPSPSPSPSGCTSPKILGLYDQCGGLSTTSYTPVDGPFACTSCPSGASCVKGSQYYYQCLNPSG